MYKCLGLVRCWCGGGFVGTLGSSAALCRLLRPWLCAAPTAHTFGRSSELVWCSDAFQAEHGRMSSTDGARLGLAHRASVPPLCLALTEHVGAASASPYRHLNAFIQQLPSPSSCVAYLPTLTTPFLAMHRSTVPCWLQPPTSLDRRCNSKPETPPSLTELVEGHVVGRRTHEAA
jgi:hypothetical protein